MVDCVVFRCGCGFGFDCRWWLGLCCWLQFPVFVIGIDLVNSVGIVASLYCIVT